MKRDSFGGLMWDLTLELTLGISSQHMNGSNIFIYRSYSLSFVYLRALRVNKIDVVSSRKLFSKSSQNSKMPVKTNLSEYFLFPSITETRVILDATYDI